VGRRPGFDVLPARASRIAQLLRAVSGSASGFCSISTGQFALAVATNREGDCYPVSRRDRAGDPHPPSPIGPVPAQECRVASVAFACERAGL
jgi:hypothetical protein